ncbi:hypothetical protein J6590_098138, partial [Homalodisca vitripennis]
SQKQMQVAHDAIYHRPQVGRDPECQVQPAPYRYDVTVVQVRNHYYFGSPDFFSLDISWSLQSDIFF